MAYGMGPAEDRTIRASLEFTGQESIQLTIDKLEAFRNETGRNDDAVDSLIKELKNYILVQKDVAKTDDDATTSKSSLVDQVKKYVDSLKDKLIPALSDTKKSAEDATGVSGDESTPSGISGLISKLGGIGEIVGTIASGGGFGLLKKAIGEVTSAIGLPGAVNEGLSMALDYAIPLIAEFVKAVNEADLQKGIDKINELTDSYGKLKEKLSPEEKKERRGLQGYLSTIDEGGLVETVAFALRQTSKLAPKEQERLDELQRRQAMGPELGMAEQQEFKGLAVRDAQTEIDELHEKMERGDAYSSKTNVQANRDFNRYNLLVASGVVPTKQKAAQIVSGLGTSELSRRQAAALAQKLPGVFPDDFARNLEDATRGALFGEEKTRQIEKYVTGEERSAKIAEDAQKAILDRISKWAESEDRAGIQAEKKRMDLIRDWAKDEERVGRLKREREHAGEVLADQLMTDERKHAKEQDRMDKAQERANLKRERAELKRERDADREDAREAREYNRMLRETTGMGGIRHARREESNMAAEFVRQQMPFTGLQYSAGQEMAIARQTMKNLEMPQLGGDIVAAFQYAIQEVMFKVKSDLGNVSEQIRGIGNSVHDMGSSYEGVYSPPGLRILH